jgi:nanoRNase/pAp phosphatase (c-di-AMP/oligoRNAs hydrolase)
MGKVSTTEKLRRFYGTFATDDHVLIVINADPDAIASAMAVKRLLWRKTGSVSIANINAVKRSDNIIMIQRLGINLTPFEDINLGDFSRFVIVDSQPSHHELLQRFDADVIIDHHPISGATAAFVDIRPHYGATASIMTEYLRAARIKPSAKLAAGLFYAIKTDTCNFERQAQIEDVRAFQFLFRHANMHLVRKIESAEIRFDFLKYYKKALDSLRMRKGRIFVHLGSVINPDVCVMLADFLLKVSNVNWTVISGIYQQKMVVIMRNDGLRKNAGKTAQAIFGSMGSAGGHKSVARAEIALSELKPHVAVKNDNQVLKWLIQRVEAEAKRK